MAINYRRILSNWNDYTTEDKERFCLFTRALSQFFGGEKDWLKSDDLTEEEFCKISDTLPISLRDEIQKRRDEIVAKTARNECEKQMNDDIEYFCGKIFEKYQGAYLNADLRSIVLNELRHTLETEFQNKENMSISSQEGSNCIFIYLNHRTSLRQQYCCTFQIGFEDDALVVKKIWGSWAI